MKVKRNAILGVNVGLSGHIDSGNRDIPRANL